MSKEKDFHNYGEISRRDVLKAIGIKFTQADKIRSMSDEELAEFLTRITNDAQLNVGAKCNYQWDEWLKSEVSE